MTTETSKSILSKDVKKLMKSGIQIELYHGITETGECTCGNPSCVGDKRGKHPRTVDGVRKPYLTIKELESDLGQWPQSNIAIRCGKDSGVIGLDCDPRNGGNESYDNLVSTMGELRETISWRSGGGGKNRLFRYPTISPKERIANQDLAAGFQVISDGKSILIPPSNHHSGKKYKWLKELRPTCGAVNSLTSTWEKKLVTTAKDERNASPPQKSIMSNSRSDVQAPIKAGSRNDTLFKLGSSLWRAGNTPETIRATLVIVNNNECDPPISVVEVDKIVASITQQQGGIGLAGQHDPSDYLAEQFLTKYYNGGAHLLHVTGLGFMSFCGTHWKPENTDVIKHHLKKLIDELGRGLKIKKDTIIDGAVRILTAECSRPEAQAAFGGDLRPIINCLNGEVHLAPDGTYKMLPHDAGSYLTGVIPVRYIPSAIAPQYEEAVKQIFGRAPHPGKMLEFFNELAGAIVSGWRAEPMILMFLGQGKNGKTVLAQLIVKMLGDAYQSASVDTLNDRFATGTLFGKLLFMDDDVPAHVKLPDGMLKKISEAKMISGERKYQNSFNFVCRAVPLLLCNHPPSLDDLSFGMRRRLIIVPFETKFTKEAGAEPKQGLFDRIFDQEASGILNLWLAGFTRVAVKGRPSRPKYVRVATKKTIGRANHVGMFIEEELDKKRKEKSRASELFQAFDAWMDSEKVPALRRVSRNNFYKKLEAFGYPLKKGAGGHRYVRGLVLKSRPISSWGDED